LILLGVPPLAGYNYITPRRAGLQRQLGFLVRIYSSSLSAEASHSGELVL